MSSQPPSQLQTAASPQPSRHGTVRRLCNGAVVAVNILGAAVLCLCAYAGLIDPESWAPAPIAVLAFAFVFPACVLILILDLIWWRRTAWIMGLAMIACAGPITDFMPLNLPRRSMSEQQREASFTLMTYNVAKFLDIPGHNPQSSQQLEYILQQSPDIVCVQESNFLAPNPQNHITQAQLDSLHHTYPYVYTQGEDLALFSKFPAEPINIDYPQQKMGGGNIAAWRLDIKGRVVNIFSVHLQSLGLSIDDKEAYEEMMQLDSISAGELRELRHEVMPKIRVACIKRKHQIEQLEKYLSKYGGPDAIVCGDFNDPVGCYAVRQLCRTSHLRQAYADAGFGPDYTFYANHLYFRIDHVLYRGDLDPYNISIRHIKASDHFPILATFILK